VSQIQFKATTFYSKDVREICSVIANTEMFIGADSGMMHLANASQVPTVGLFSATVANKYKPYGNNSIAINTITSSIDEWFKILNNIAEP